MLDINYVRENTDEVKKKVATKNFDAKLIDEVLELDEKRRKLISEIDELRAKRNEIAPHGKPTEAEANAGKEIKEKLQELEPQLQEVEEKYKELLFKIPNIPSDDSPIGKDESFNKVIRKWGDPRKFDFKVRDHVEIGKILGIIDTDTAAEVAGARFNYLKGDLVLLQNALYQFVLSVLIEKGFTPIIPPLILKAETMKKMARHDPVDDRYYFKDDDAMLVGSAEHALGPMHMNQTLNEKDLPLRYFAYTPAFRREAGTYGKDTRGILRQHQFDKVEMESFTTPADGSKEQELFVGIQEHLMQTLKLPYQVIAISTGDMGTPDFRQIDIETWMPGQDKYRETNTSDYVTDYQSRRLNTKVKTKDGNEFVHMNDATAFAMGRTLIAILENYQNEDGSVNVPEVLQKWMGKKKISKK
ncbi:serine--tRNA ligase [soil metagenome]